MTGAPSRRAEGRPVAAIGGLSRSARAAGSAGRLLGAGGLRLQVSERRILLALLDLLAVNLALLATVGLRPDHPLSWRLPLRHPEWFLYLSALWYLMAGAFDVYNLRLSAHWGTAARAVVTAGLSTAFVYLMTPFLTPTLPPSRRYLVALIVLTPAFLVVGRGLYVAVLAHRFFQLHTLIVGAGRAGRAVVEVLRLHGDDTYRIVGFVDDDVAKRGATIDGGLRVLGDRDDLHELLDRHAVGALILAITGDIDGELLRDLMGCRERGIEIVPMAEVYEQHTGRVPVEHISPSSWLAMPIRQPSTAWPGIKRGFDLVFASLGIVLLGALLPFVAVAIRLDSRGPVFYAQQRLGKGGLPFRMYKFRTMVPDAEDGEAVWATANDRRATRVGRILRRLHLDELPQFLNVLRGDMSLVGPRPERPELADRLAREIPFYGVRHAVRPGMAGWGGVRQGYAAGPTDALVKLEYDLYYIKHQSMWLDAVIVVKAMFHALTFKGR